MGKKEHKKITQMESNHAKEGTDRVVGSNECLHPTRWPLFDERTMDGMKMRNGSSAQERQSIKDPTKILIQQLTSIPPLGRHMWKPTNMIWSYTSMLWDCFGCKVFS
jgi:hypothetical protein